MPRARCICVCTYISLGMCAALVQCHAQLVRSYAQHHILLVLEQRVMLRVCCDLRLTVICLAL